MSNQQGSLVMGYPRNGGNKNPSFARRPSYKVVHHPHIHMYIYIWDMSIYIYICTCIQFIYHIKHRCLFPGFMFRSGSPIGHRAAQVRRADFRLMELLCHEIQKLRRPYGSATGQVLLERIANGSRTAVVWSHGMGPWDMKFLPWLDRWVFHAEGPRIGERIGEASLMQENGERTGCLSINRTGCLLLNHGNNLLS